MSEIDYARYDRVRPLRWSGEALELLDQRQLQFVQTYLQAGDSDAVAAAIRDLVVRGEATIGICGVASAVVGEPCP